MPPYVEAGRLPAVFGRYRFSRTAESLLVRRPVSQVIEARSVKRSNPLDVQKISALAVLPSPAAVLVGIEQLPVDITGPFIQAGQKFTDHLERYCRNILFVRDLETVDGPWAAGFEISNSGADIPEIQALSRELDPDSRNLQTMMFLSLRDETCQTFRATRFHETMGHLLGRMMVTPLLSEINFVPETLGATAREHFAYSYQMHMTVELANYHSQKKDNAASPDKEHYEARIRAIAAAMSSLHLTLTPLENEIVHTIIDQVT
ncbi:hypothetical protein ACFL37_00840 [Candidatus Margulisiibacteriota bacterium]